MSAAPRSLADRRAAVLARASSATLLASALVLYGLERPDEAQRAARAWTVDELERRHPDAAEILARKFDELADDPRPLNYAELLRDALRETGAVR